MFMRIMIDEMTHFNQLYFFKQDGRISPLLDKKQWCCIWPSLSLIFDYKEKWKLSLFLNEQQLLSLYYMKTNNMKYSCITHVLEVSYSNEILFSAWLFLCNTSAFYYSINSLATRISFLNEFMKSKHKRTIKY